MLQGDLWEKHFVTGRNLRLTSAWTEECRRYFCVWLSWSLSIYKTPPDIQICATRPFAESKSSAMFIYLKDKTLNEHLGKSICKRIWDMRYKSVWLLSACSGVTYGQVVGPATNSLREILLIDYSRTCTKIHMAKAKEFISGVINICCLRL